MYNIYSSHYIPLFSQSSSSNKVDIEAKDLSPSLIVSIRSSILSSLNFNSLSLLTSGSGFSNSSTKNFALPSSLSLSLYPAQTEKWCITIEAATVTFRLAVPAPY